jgi:peptide/nickel transport system ATP-binding protein
MNTAAVRVQAAVVAIEDLTLDFPTYRGVIPALAGVSIEVAPGEIVGLVGESGSGKSVTAMSVVRLLPEGAMRVRQGQIKLLGRDVLGASEAGLQDMRGRLASMIFQEPMNALNPTIRIGRQIIQVIRQHEPVGEAEAADRAQRLLTEMQVQDAARVMQSFPFELSGGMRQRVLIAMAFACNPKLLIADEPTTALDVTVQAQVLALLRERARERGTAVLFITHDLAVVAQLCSRVYVMYAGRIAEQGATAEVLRHPLHPYTRALLRSLPEAAVPKQPLAAIPGAAASAGDVRAGCPFRPRCGFAHERCATLPPLLPDPAGSAQSAACWLVAEGAVSYAAADSAAKAPEATSTGAALLALQGLEVRFPAEVNWLGRPRAYVHALSGVDLEVRRGETLGIVGESGCGKTTLGQAVMRLVRPTGGRVIFDGADVWAASGEALTRLRRRFQVVFQDPQSSLDPRMPVGEVIAEPLAVVDRLNAPVRRARVRQLAEQVGLRPELLSRYPHEFSGGQRQRIAIARALALEPSLLVLDEPTSALDVSVQAQILNLLAELQGRLHLTYLFISHNVAVIRHIADRVAVMYLGQIVELGNAAEVLERPAHPYTRALLAAVPKLDAATGLEMPLRNTELPSNRRLPAGCFFRERCPFAVAACTQPQSLAPLAGAARSVRCHRAAELLAHRFGSE